MYRRSLFLLIVCLFLAVVWGCQGEQAAGPSAAELPAVSVSQPVGLSVYQLPGTNALDVADAVRAKMEELKERFPEGIAYEIGFDTTPFIRESVWDVFKTLLIARMAVNIFTQIGFVVLVGLASKNAILIVEFAKQQQEAGVPRWQATLEACRLRLRPILMTSFAFILGVVPLVLAKGAGAEMRQALGMAVFAGMLGVTSFGVFLTPVFYYVIQWFDGPPKPTHLAPVLPDVNVALHAPGTPQAVAGREGIVRPGQT
jgi:multidrug efflux pump subunit AcrB